MQNRTTKTSRTRTGLSPAQPRSGVRDAATRLRIARDLLGLLHQSLALRAAGELADPIE